MMRGATSRLAAFLVMAMPPWALAADPAMRLRSAVSGQCLDVKGWDGSQGDNVMLWDCNDGTDQTWTLDAQGRLLNAAQNLCLDVAGHDGEQGDNVKLWGCDEGQDQNWSLVERSPGQFEVHNAQKDLCLSAEASKRGANVSLRACKGERQQLWNWERAPGFYVIFASDTQYPWTDDGVKRSDEQVKKESERLNRDQIKSMKALVAQLPSGSFRGVVINGDLTAFGHDWQLDKYKALWDSSGLELYPGLGNHDYANNVNDCFENNCAIRMVEYMRERIGGRSTASFDDFKESDSYTFPTIRKTFRGSLAYSWNIADVHFVQLHNYPAYETKFSGYVAGKARTHEFEITSSMSWLRADVTKARNEGKKVILNMHDAEDHFQKEHAAAYRTFLSMLDELGVSATFAGHIHSDCGKYDLSNDALFFRSGASSYATYLLAHFNGNELTVEKVSSQGGGVRRTLVGTYPLIGGKPPQPLPTPDKDGAITFFNEGGYVARFELTFVGPGGKKVVKKTGDMALGNKKRYTLPADSTKVHVKGEANTGLVWEPWRKIFDKDVKGTPITCFKSYNTTLAPKWNKDCN